MTGFIANAALGDSRVGSLEYDTLFAVGLLLFLFTLVINIDQHPVGPPVPGGVLMPTPPSTAREVAARRPQGQQQRVATEVR